VALKQVSPTDEFIKGLWRDNPVFIQVLGLCPALAVSNTAINALAMGLATTFVLLMAGLSVSLLRNFIPREARIVSYICIIATFVALPSRCSSSAWCGKSSAAARCSAWTCSPTVSRPGL